MPPTADLDHMRAAVLVTILATSACAPRLAIGIDSTAKVDGPLANISPIARRTALSGIQSIEPPPEGHNYSVGLGFGDKNFTLGMRVQGNDLSGATLGDDGPQYVSAAAQLEFRYAFLRLKGIGVTALLAPGRTVLVDTTNGGHNWGSGIRYGGALSYTLAGFSVFADVYQEQLVFVDGPAEGRSSREGVTVGLSFQP